MDTDLYFSSASSICISKSRWVYRCAAHISLELEPHPTFVYYQHSVNKFEALL